MRERPLGIWIITVLQLVLTGTLVLAVWSGSDLFSTTAGRRLEEAARPVYLVWVVLTVVAALLLWRMSRPGWVLTMLLTGVGLAANLWLWWTGEPNYLRLALQVAVAFYINSAAVRERFLSRPEIPRIAIRGDGET